MASKIGAIALTLAICSSTLSPTGVRAENGQIAAGVLGGLIGGALLGGALARARRRLPCTMKLTRLYDAPVCREVRQRYWDGFVWLYRGSKFVIEISRPAQCSASAVRS